MLSRHDFKLIAHRGNRVGPSAEENSPRHIMDALDEGFDVEIDLWCEESQLMLGHGAPEYVIEESFLLRAELWIHCKSMAALQRLQELHRSSKRYSHLNYFWHQTDGYTLTSQGQVWTYPGMPIPGGGIAVGPEMVESDWDMTPAGGICPDYVVRYRP